jgi:hypothetical protein
MPDTLPNNVKAVFASYDSKLRDRLLICRDLVFQVAAAHELIGPVTETLKWGQPSYLTEATGAGTSLRLGKDGSSKPAVFVHCATDLIDQFRTFYPDTFSYQGKRALIIEGEIAAAEDELRHCIGLTLTYKLRKKRAHRGLLLRASDTKTL